MKTKLFFAAMAAVAVIGCQKEHNAPVVADGQASFLKVNLNTAGAITKADPGSFVSGTDAENKVNSVTFYFFDAGGEKYVIQNMENYMTGNVTDWTSVNSASIEEVSGLILVIKQSNGDVPAQMVAVLNAPTELQRSMTLAELNESINTLYDENNGFIMSNSVYVKENEENKENNVVIQTTAITKANLFNANLVAGDPGYNAPGTILDPDDTDVPDDIAPVEIYVERIATKVTVEGAENVSLEKIPVYAEDGTTQLTVGEGENVKEVFVKITGWDITNNTASSHILKQLEATYSPAPFTPWNNASFFRSYWANTDAEPLHNLKYTDLTSTLPKYYHENTAAAKESNGVDVDLNGTYEKPNKSANQAPQLLVAATLINAAGNPIDLARWYGKNYTEAGVKDAMIATVDHRLYTRTGEGTEVSPYEFAPITADNVVFSQTGQAEENERYEVYASANPNVKYFDAAGNLMDIEDVNVILNAIEPAQIWKDGRTYYYTTISHFGNSKGMVRNHCYQILIDSVKGFGTPVYEPGFVITPEKPVDSEAVNLSARINILQWHLVNQTVTLQ